MPVLYHFSEDPSIEEFIPHVARTAQDDEARVWAIHEDRQQLYWFPRQCPRIAFWPSKRTPPGVAASYHAQTASPRVHAAEWGWYERIRNAVLYRYSFDPGPFEQLDDVAGHWIARDAVRPLSVERFDDLLGRHAAADEELRFVPSFWPLWDYVITSGLEFSGTRLRNATRARP